MNNHQQLVRAEKHGWVLGGHYCYDPYAYRVLRDGRIVVIWFRSGISNPRPEVVCWPGVEAVIRAQRSIR